MIVLLVWLMWFAVTCFLTLVGIVVLAGAGIVYLAGTLLAAWKPEAGKAMMAVGQVVFGLTVELVDRMNGHKRKQPEPVVVHSIDDHGAGACTTHPAPPELSKAELIARAQAAYVEADLIDEDDDSALLEQRIGAIMGVERQSVL
jgi:hypothetical protein